MTQKIAALEPILLSQPVIPVVQIDDLADAIPLAEALIQGGIRAIEVTLRSGVALDAIKNIASNVPQAIVGAGTVLNREQYFQAVERGAKFIVSPGMYSSTYGAAYSNSVPYLPGVITPSEIMEALNREYTYMKFFPAEQAGGIDYLKALAGPFPQVKFCPTGGITAASAAEWLKLPNVVCVGGSWLAPKNLIKSKDWAAISQLAQEAMALR